MRTEGRLSVAAGFASETGHRPANEDFGAVYLGSAIEQATRGILAALADGMGGAKGGRIAAELAVHSLIEGYYAAPETIGPGKGAERPLAAYNRWLHAQGRTETMQGAGTTLTALIVKGRRAHVVHVGDSRAWHLRGDRLTCLTQDHTLARAELSHVLYRAVGLEERLRLDHAEVDLVPHDRLLLTSDGVHGALGEKRLAALLGARGSAEADSTAIVEAALVAGTRDNATAIVLDIIALPETEYVGVAAELARLPILPPPEAGESVDGFLLEARIADSRHARLFRSVDTTSGETVLVKFPKTELVSETGARMAFAREIVIGQRIDSPFVGSGLPVAPERQSRLFGVQPLYAGETMEVRLSRGLPPMRAGIAHAIQLTRAVVALHRLHIIHRDIKPENVLLEPDGGLKLIDLGVARLPRTEDFHTDEIPGTPGHMAPEQFSGNAGDPLTDQFALGVTLYRWFTGRWPFGEQEAFQRPRFGSAPRPSSHRPEMPAWLDAALLRAIALDPAKRHGDAIELLRLLEGGGAISRTEHRSFVPLIERDPVRFWQGVALLLALALIAVVALS